MSKKGKTQSLTIISTNELEKKIHDQDNKIIDIRTPEAYNGWILRNELRGGHISSARNIPYKWSEYIDWIEIVRSKGILPKHTVIVYGYDQGRTEKVAYQFIKAGYPNVHAYHDFINEWSPNTSLPMDKLKRYQNLVSANWLNTLITTDKAPKYNNTKYVICHTHYRNRDAYEKGHITKAIDLDTNLLESPKTWNRRSPKELKNTLESLGITYDTTVILYGRFSYPNNNDPFPGSSAGQLAAFRCAFIMMYAGIQDIRILNGGLQAWIDAGLKTTTKEYKKNPVNNFGITIPLHPEIMVDAPEAKEILTSPYKNLVCVRSWNEFIGTVSGYNYITKKGRIPGAVFGNCGTDAYHMQNYRNLDHTTREYHEIEQMWKQVGVTPDKHNSFYCGTGWRGSEAFFNAWLMGWENISVYDGGWFEWSNSNLPYETGDLEDNQKQILVEGNYF